ncbi:MULTISPECIES: FtsW/RodA/SpoVE family cell cycle protein [Curvivirga]|uniref:FtsW/RodA/SpoVE family cell cycle protein n=1 Tax=Curvivirga TaxID=2856846 RepID=UPI0012BC4AFE|nr:putative peptidoglycan glycosyltransferase FtsW [Curvivirga aplysinae]MTI10782.1 cell division protein FtsW [Curvivirga aplysinae]
MNIARNDTSILGRWWWEVDRWTLFCFIVLAGFGLVLTASASPSVAERIGADSMFFIRKQAVMVVPAVMLMLTISLLDLKNIKRLAGILLLFSIVMMFATLAFGSEIKGATRWIRVAGINLQPSEFLKPAFAVVAATMFSAQRMGEKVPGFWMASGLYLFMVALLMAQPDFGQTVIVSAIWGVQFFLAGLPLVIVLSLLIMMVVGIASAYFFFPHVQSRIDRFLDPASGDTYQVDRAMEAFSNGGVLGMGPGNGTAKNVLPDGHADFILAVAGEEYGLIACLVILFMYGFVVLRGFSLIFSRNNMFVILAVTGLLLQFGLQAMINMSSTLTLIPTKGMTLPFVSYGGSSLIAMAIGMGMVLALTRNRPGNYQSSNGSFIK